MSHKEQVKEVLDRMQSRRFWHRDHEKKADVVCVRFDLLVGPKPDRKVLNNPVEEARAFVSFLKGASIDAYVHYGPTGEVFAAVVCSDEQKQRLNLLAN